MCSLNVRRVSFNLVRMKIIPTENFPLRLRFEMVIEDNYGDDDDDEGEEGGPVVRSPVSVKGCPAKADSTSPDSPEFLKEDNVGG